MTNEPTFTARDFLDAIFEQICPHAINPKEFASEWERITSELDNEIKELQQIMLRRDDLVRELLILVRTQLAQSYLFDDLWLQHSQGCTILSDYADLTGQSDDDDQTSSSTPKPSGHKCDEIVWDSFKGHTMPDCPEKRLDFHGTHENGWPYCSCLDHAISNLICKVWGFSSFTGSSIWNPLTTSRSFNAGWWQDKSTYLAVLLSFGVNILEDQEFLQSVDVHFKEGETAKEKLQCVLAASKPAHFWIRTKEIIISPKQSESE